MGKRQYSHSRRPQPKRRRGVLSEHRDDVKRDARVQEEKANEIESSSSSEESEEETVVQQLVKSLGGSLNADEEIEEESSEEDEEEEHGSGDDDGSDSDSENAGTEEEEEKAEGEKTEEEEEAETEEVMEEGDEEGEYQLKENDLFSIHFERDLPEKLAEQLSSAKWKEEDIKVKSVGEGRVLWKNSKLVSKDFKVQKDLKKIGVKHKLAGQARTTNVRVCEVALKKDEDVLTPFEYGLFSIINRYQDLLYPCQTHSNTEEIRLTYCLHAVNHVLKTRSRVIAHNTKLKSRGDGEDDTEVEYRDQGLTRPKVLIVVPTRHGVYRVISIIISLLSSSDQEVVSNRKRFNSEYGPEGHDDDQKGLKPGDYNATFAGNIDEHFRIGLSVSKKSLRLYSPFYMADIIIASPLGLRTIIGAEGDRKRDYDFLSSIEVLILDQTDFFLMQNWDHVTHLFDHLHLPLKGTHNMDFTRSRMWALDGLSHHYRQTLIFSSVLMPELLTLFRKDCHNYSGKVEVLGKPPIGSVCHVYVQLPQTFHRFECDSPADMSEARFQFFLKEVLPPHKEKDMKQTLIFIPSYFDFVRIRNYFTKNNINFTHINEYASSKGIRRARIEFKKKRSHFMLYTERIHFYRRFKLRGPKHIIFYALPQYPQFYAEMCNMLLEPGRVSVDMLTCTVLYSPWDQIKLMGVVGMHRTEKMLASKKSVHMLVSGDTS